MPGWQRFCTYPAMYWDNRQARITLLLFLAVVVMGQGWLYFTRPVYPEPAAFPERWPPQGSLVDASALQNWAMELFPVGTTAAEAITRLGLEVDPLGSAFCLPRAGILYRGDTGWRIRPMNQLERYVWRIPMELSLCTPGDLERIRGIGPVLARNIHRFVRERGYLDSVDELDSVPGVGPAKLSALKRELALN